MNRAALLKYANKALDRGEDVTRDDTSMRYALLAIGNILLAKELREGGDVEEGEK